LMQPFIAALHAMYDQSGSGPRMIWLDLRWVNGKVKFLPREKKVFSPEYRDEAVKMVIETSRPIAKVAKELGINEGTLDNWVDNVRRSISDSTTGASLLSVIPPAEPARNPRDSPEHETGTQHNLRGHPETQDWITNWDRSGGALMAAEVEAGPFAREPDAARNDQARGSP
jgi:transposase-like protein